MEFTTFTTNTIRMDVNELNNLKRKVGQYKEVLENTLAYRKAWTDHLHDYIVNLLTEISGHAGIDAKIETVGELENMDAIVFSLGDTKSGMFQQVNDNIQRHLIKHNGSLVYQQLFNGKVIVLINYPYIEGIGQPHPHKVIAIYRPEEMKEPFFVRHVEEFITEVTKWEDYDDDDEEPSQTIGYKFNFMKDGDGDLPK